MSRPASRSVSGPIGHAVGLLALAVVAALPRPALAQPARRPTAGGPRLTARFDWLEYEGRDSVYRTTTAGPGAYLNPILPGFYPDPTIVRAGDAFYLATSSFAYFPGVPIFRSQDLVHWTQLGHVLDRPSQLPLDSAGMSRGIYAPALSYHDGTFYLITTNVARGGNFVVTATDPAGPWSEPTFLPAVDGIDPSLFFDDDDGRAYVVNNGPPAERPLYEGHRAIWLQEFDAKTRRTVGPRTVIVDGGVDLAKHPIWVEGPHVFRRNGHYYLICAEGGTAYQHSEVVFRSDDLRGPWVPYPGNPILTQRALDPWRTAPVTTTGHADFVQLPNGEWWAVFLGVRPYRDDYFNTGRETFLMPVRWENDWPIITRDQERVPYVHAGPTIVPGGAPTANAKADTSASVTWGNRTVRDEFDGPRLAPTWVGIRTPRTPFYDLTSAPGALTLLARPVALGDFGQPSFLGRRQQHAHAVVTTAVHFAPRRDGDQAGIAAFQNDAYYYAFTIAMAGGRRVVQLTERAGPITGGRDVVVATAPLPADAAPDAPVFLRITARGAQYDFDYATRPGAWTPLAHDADGTILSTRVAGGFQGTTIGPYAYAAP